MQGAGCSAESTSSAQTQDEFSITPQLGVADPSFRALYGRLKLTVRRHKFDQDYLLPAGSTPHLTPPPRLPHVRLDYWFVLLTMVMITAAGESGRARGRTRQLQDAGYGAGALTSLTLGVYLLLVCLYYWCVFTTGASH